MGNFINRDKLLLAAEAYKIEEKRVSKDFLGGVLRLGKILHREKQIWKAQSRWTEFLENVGRSMAGANQFIRLYLYSEEHAEEIYKVGFINWSNINKFLSLPDDIKTRLLEIEEEEDTFNDKLEQVYDDEIEEEIQTMNLEEIEKVPLENDFSEMTFGLSLDEQKTETIKLFDGLVKQSIIMGESLFPGKVSTHTKGFIGANLLMKSAMTYLNKNNTDNHLSKMSDIEKEYWIKKLKETKRKLSNAIKEVEGRTQLST